MNTQTTMNPNKIARIAGLLYLPPWVLSLAAVLFRQSLIAPGDAATTASQLVASEGLFRFTIVIDLLVQVIFCFLVLVLYKLLSQKSGFTPTDMQILELLATDAATALVSARLNNTMGRRLKTIEGFLGKEYQVKSCFGHIMDLSKKDLGVDIDNGFVPKYIISPEKKKIVTELKKQAKAAELVWLASDVHFYSMEH